MKKLTWLAGAALLFFCFAFRTGITKKTIVIDAGHGGEDHGAIHDELAEKELVLAIASKIKQFSSSTDIEIVLLREEDEFLSLEQRVEKINAIRPDLLLSLHVNYANDRKENGISAFVSKQSSHYAASREKAELLVDAITNKRLAKKEIKDVNTYVLSRTNCPGICLEIGYLTNESDRVYISSGQGQNEIAQNIAAFLKY